MKLLQLIYDIPWAFLVIGLAGLFFAWTVLKMVRERQAGRITIEALGPARWILGELGRRLLGRPGLRLMVAGEGRSGKSALLHLLRRQRLSDPGELEATANYERHEVWGLRVRIFSGASRGPARSDRLNVRRMADAVGQDSPREQVEQVKAFRATHLIVVMRADIFDGEKDFFGFEWYAELFARLREAYAERRLFGPRLPRIAVFVSHLDHMRSEGFECEKERISRAFRALEPRPALIYYGTLIAPAASPDREAWDEERAARLERVLDFLQLALKT